MRLAKYIAGRLMSCACVLFFAVTLMYLLPAIKGDASHPVSVEGYFDFLKSVIQNDYGMSRLYKADIGTLVSRYMPYTMLLCLTSTIIAWVIGNAIGLFAGAGKSRIGAKIAEGAAMLIYPIPYYIMALAVQIIFTCLLPWFPTVSKIMLHNGIGTLVRTLIVSSALPAITLIISGLGWWILSMRALSESQLGEDYVKYARMRGIREGTVIKRYVLRNCFLPQFAALAVQIGVSFGGAIMTEMIFQYPGVGFLMQRAAVNNDYNLLYGASIISMIVITLTTFIADMLYPIIDPRVRLQ